METEKPEKEKETEKENEKETEAENENEKEKAHENEKEKVKEHEDENEKATRFSTDSRISGGSITGSESGNESVNTTSTRDKDKDSPHVDTTSTSSSENDPAVPSIKSSHMHALHNNNINITCQLTDGFTRWIRGVGQPNFLVATIHEQTLAYVSGCHIKYLKLNTHKAEEVGIFHPQVGGIGILEGNPALSIFAIAETTRRPRILIYRFEEPAKETQVAELKGCAEFEYRAVRFTRKDLLLVLVGVPEFTVSVWRWADESELLVVKSLENPVTSHLIISHAGHAFDNYWIEWSDSYITFYELQAFTENNVIRTEISLPPNQADPFEPDPRRGAKSAIDIVDVTWTNAGDFYVLDTQRNVYKLNIPDKSLVKIGPIRYEMNSDITGLFPYDSYLGAGTSTGIFLILSVEIQNGINLKGHLELSGNIWRFLPYSVGARVLSNSFYAINDVDRKLDIVIDGKVRATMIITDLINSNIQYATFIEPHADYVATVSDSGIISLWDSKTGAFFTRWRLPLKALTIICHPLIPYVAVGTHNGTIIFLDIRNLETPKIMYRGYLNNNGVIDRIVFSARGKLVVSGEASSGKIFLQYGLPTLEFMYLDHAVVEGKICHMNVPSQHRDLRLQILTKGPEDEIVSYLHNFKLDNDQLDLVASQALDAPMTTFCFSPFKRLMYCYSCEGMGIGLIPYTEDMQAGSLKEPDLQFNFDFQLDLNRIRVLGNNFYTFSQDGFVMVHQPPAPKHPDTVTHHRIQTHFFGQGGVIDGIISRDGTQILAIGKDRTIVHIRIEEKPKSPDWEVLGLGKDMKDITKAQMKVFDSIKVEKMPLVRTDELTLVEIDKHDQHDFKSRKYLKETREIEHGIQKIKDTVRKLLKENASRPEEDKLEMDEFELDSDEDEVLNEEFAQDKQIAEAEVTSILEERHEWVLRMKELVWDSFNIKGSRVNGFSFSREITNYPLVPITPEYTSVYNETIHTRKFETKVAALEDEINRIGAAASVNVLQIVLGMGGNEQPASVNPIDAKQANKGVDPISAAEALENLLEDTITKQTEEDGYGGEDEDENEEDAPNELDHDHDHDPAVPSKLPIVPAGGAGNLFGTPGPAQQNVPDKNAAPTPDGVPKNNNNDVIVTYTGGAGANGTESRDETYGADGDRGNYDYGLDDYDLLDGEGTGKRKKLVVITTDSGETKTIEVEEEGTSEDSASDDEAYEELKAANKKDIDNLEKEEKEKMTFLDHLYSGSSSYHFMEPNDLLYDQLELSARHHVRNQMIIIQNEIRRLKEYFNQEFEDIRGMKEGEMRVMRERNQRLREITDYFDLNMDLTNPAWTQREDLANVFIVRDDEIPFEPYYTEEELAEILRKRLEEEARRLAAQDDFRERALMTMMDGVLETRREDILKQDIPKPMFMIVKEEWEWNAEEYKIAEDYHKKVTKLEAERAEFKKELELELRNLIRQNADSKQVVDDRIKDLWKLKVRVEMCIRMEQIKLCRMVKQIMRRHQMAADEDRLSVTLKKLQDSMKSSQNLASQLLTRVEACAKRYEFVTDRERILEKTFRRDLGEVGHFFDLFMRLYKKRPKLGVKNDKSPDVTDLMIKAIHAPNLHTFGADHGELGGKVATSILELDDPIQNPMGCPRSTWDRFCALRRDKILSEYESRAIGSELLELKQALAECKGREDEVAMAIANVLANLTHQRDIIMANLHNFEFQMVLSQGQVELPDACTRSDFYNAVLLKKKFIEICNHFITKYGSIKLRAMNRGKALHRQIKQYEWRFKHATLTKRNLLDEFHDINTIKATKEILAFIKQGRNFKKMQEARLQKIRELQVLSEQFHKKFMDYQRLLLKLAGRQQKSIEHKNSSSEKLIFEQNLYVNEARLMCNLDFADEKESHLKRRMAIIMQTGRMMRRIARNAEEVVLLENELDRQYRRTYPVL